MYHCTILLTRARGGEERGCGEGRCGKGGEEGCGKGGVGEGGGPFLGRCCYYYYCYCYYYWVVPGSLPSTSLMRRLTRRLSESRLLSRRGRRPSWISAVQKAIAEPRHVRTSLAVPALGAISKGLVTPAKRQLGASVPGVRWCAIEATSCAPGGSSEEKQMLLPTKYNVRYCV